MSRRLTPQSSLDGLKKEAKVWLKALRANDPQALARFEQAYPQAPTNPTLRDVQRAIALEHGLAGWNDLTRRLAGTTLPQYEEMAEALLEAYRTGTPSAMERHGKHTWHRRSWEGMRTYVQLDMGKRPESPNQDIDISLSDARLLVAREHGFQSWQALTEYVAALPSKPGRIAAKSVTLLSLDEEGQQHIAASERDWDAVLGMMKERKIPAMNAEGQMTDTVLGRLSRLDHITSLNLNGSKQLTDAGLPLFHEFPVFKTWQGGEARLALLSADAGPNYLSLRGSFTDVGLATLTGLDGLYALNLDDNTLAVTAAGLAPLATLPNLSWLAFDADDEAMSYIAALPKLRFLMCQDTEAGDDGFVALSRSRSIETIWGRRCYNLRSRGFAALAEMPALRALSVSCKNVDDAGLSALPRFPALRELMPMDAPDDGYRHIGRCNGLEALILMYCRETTDLATEHIVGLRNLKRYFASYTRITDRTPERLSTISLLEQVEFSGCAGLTNNGIAALARLPHLRELRVDGMPNVTPDVAASFPASIRVHIGI